MIRRLPLLALTLAAVGCAAAPSSPYAGRWYTAHLAENAPHHAHSMTLVLNNDHSLTAFYQDQHRNLLAGFIGSWQPESKSTIKLASAMGDTTADAALVSPATLLVQQGKQTMRLHRPIMPTQLLGRWTTTRLPAHAAARFKAMTLNINKNHSLTTTLTNHAGKPIPGFRGRWQPQSTSTIIISNAKNPFLATARLINPGTLQLASRKVTYTLHRPHPAAKAIAKTSAKAGTKANAKAGVKARRSRIVH